MVENLQTGRKQNYDFDRSRVTIGRAADADLMIADPSLLDIQAAVEVDDGRARFFHFDERADATINGRSVPRNTAALLPEGAEVRLTEGVGLTISTRAPALVAGGVFDGVPNGVGLPVGRAGGDTVSMPIRAVPEASPHAAGPAGGPVPSLASARAQSYELPAGAFVDGLPPGTRFAEIYEVVRPLGAGGMGAVYKGIDHRRRREIAIKTISPSHMSSPNALARFEREVAAAAAVRHPNIAEIYDSGV
jgi:hypothetical protein